MHKITLINMPFANLRFPSIALTQLRSVLERELGDRVRVRVLYFNQEFAHYLGLDVYERVTGTLEANNSGFGDWLFRQAAFPRQPDNTDHYLQRYFPANDARRQALEQIVRGKRGGIDRFFQRLVMVHQLDQEDLVGFTSMFAQNTACFAMARVIKEKKPKVVTVIGGANCEAPMGQEIARHVDAIDFAFAGPGLVSFPEFVRHQMAGEPEKCHQIQGVFSRRNVDAEQVGGQGAVGAIGRELPLDVPVPLDYESFLRDLAKGFPNGRIRPSLTFETSRGCWWGERSHCTFCGLNGGTMAYRAMPTEHALELLQDLFARYADRCTHFESVDNILPREYLTEVFPRLETPPGVTLFYEVKADLKDREMEVLSRAGVTEIQPGIEALATSTLKLMRKGTTSFQNVNFLKGCVRHGIRPAWNLLIGFPGEGEEVYRKYLDDIPRLVHLPPPAGAFPVRFDRFSPYFTRAKEYGLDLAPYDFYRAIYPFPDEVLQNLAYYFEDRNYSDYVDKLITWQGRLAAAVTAWQKRWHAEDGLLRPELVLERRGVRGDGGDGGTVRDTRSGERIDHEMSPLAVAILDFAQGNGWRVADIAGKVGAAEEEVAAEIARLDGLGLVFHENGRYSSLALAERNAEAALPAHGAALAGASQATGEAAGAR